MSEKRKPSPPLKLSMGFDEALERFAKVRPDELGAEPAPQGELELIHYETPGCSADFRLDPSNETVWATQQQIADTFGISTSTVRGHLTNIFKEGELDEKSVARHFRARGQDGKLYRSLEYSLDAILSVGYRVSSKRATAFRKWATQTLKDYIIQGFALDEARLKDDPKALRELASRVRALRAGEVQIYQAVRDAFKIGSVDYDKDSDLTRSFYAKLQDKFLYAITGKTASEIILERADRKEPNMGLTSVENKNVALADAKIGKNYLDGDELYALHILCEQFLLFIESRALRGQPLTMAEMASKFDELIAIQGHPVFREYKDFLKNRAMAHAEREFEEYKNELRRLSA
jgi:hypothetical protein